MTQDERDHIGRQGAETRRLAEAILKGQQSTAINRLRAHLAAKDRSDHRAAVRDRGAAPGRETDE